MLGLKCLKACMVDGVSCRSAQQEMNVFLDILAIAQDKKYLVLDEVSNFLDAGKLIYFLKKVFFKKKIFISFFNSKRLY